MAGNFEADLENERRALWGAVDWISKVFSDKYIDLDDTIEELRPIRMRVYQIKALLNKKKQLDPALDSKAQ